MSTREKLIKARLGMLALAEELQNISWACPACPGASPCTVRPNLDASCWKSMSSMARNPWE